MDIAAKETLSVTCPKCNARYSAPLSAAGKRTACLRCRAEIQIPEHPTRDELEADAYELDESSAPGARPPVVLLTPHERIYESSPSSGTNSVDSCIPSKRPVPPKWPLLRGVFGFPLQPGVAIRTVVLAVWLAIDIAVFFTSMNFIMAGYGAFIGVCLFGVTLILSPIWLSAASACWLTVLQDSSDGIDRIESWPDAMFIDWMLNGFYVLMAIAVATVPGWAIYMFTTLDDSEIAMACPILFFVIFPFVLLSMLEVNSPWAIFSPPVFESLLRAPIAWLFFYIESFLLVAVLAFGSNWVFQSNQWLVLLIVPIVLAGTFVYFRLLGRLGWCLAQSVRPK